MKKLWKLADFIRPQSEALDGFGPQNFYPSGMDNAGTGLANLAQNKQNKFMFSKRLEVNSA